eukprot:6209767-Pleurochrysis_carterae.AAC.4
MQKGRNGIRSDLSSMRVTPRRASQSTTVYDQSFAGRTATSARWSAAASAPMGPASLGED